MLDILLTLTSLTSGMLIGVLLMWSTGTTRPSPASQKLSDSNEPPQESIHEAVMRLQGLAYSFAATVEVHNDRVEDISETLTKIGESAGDQAAAQPVLAAIESILAANKDMQAELQRANSRLVEQSQELEQARNQARTDALTGVCNRLAFEEFLHSSIAEFESSGRPTSLLMIDVDNFRHFNDTHGHSAGDAVLAHAASYLKSRLGSRGLVARYGGEEFAVIFAGGEASHLQHIVEQARADLALLEISFGEQNYTITCSAGLSQLVADDTYDKLIDRADEGLYLSKDEGRNCGHWWNGEKWIRMTRQAVGRDATSKTTTGSVNSSDANTADTSTEPTTQDTSEVRQVSVAEAKMELGNSTGEGDSDNTNQREIADNTIADAVIANPKEAQVTSSANESASSAVEEPKRDIITDIAAPKTISDAVEDDAPINVLAWDDFLDRMKAGMDQAARLDLPLSVLMVSYKKKSGSKETFPTEQDIPLPILRSANAGVKGLDVIGKYDETTLTILLRGCEESISIGRAALVRHALEAAPLLSQSFRIDMAVAESGTETQAIKLIDSLKEALTMAKFEPQPSLAIYGRGDCRIAEANELVLAAT